MALRSRKRIVAGFAGAAIVLIVPAVVWACGGRQTTYVQASPSVGAAGTAVTVTGFGFGTASYGGTGNFSPINVYWNEAIGTPLATVDPGSPEYYNGGALTAHIFVPSVAPDTYQIVMVQNAANNAPGTATKAATPFTVRGPAESSGALVPPPATTNTNLTTSGSSAPPASNPGYTQPASAGGGSSTVAVPGAPAVPAAPAPVSAATAGGDAGYGSSVAPGGVNIEGLIGALSAPGSPAAAAVAPASGAAAAVVTDVNHDVWSADRGISLASASSPAGNAGFLVLAIGLVAMVGGVGLAQVRRRLSAREF